MAKRRKTDDPSQDNLENQNDADNFGLPDLEYKPLDTEEPLAEPEEEELAQEETQPQSTYHEETGRAQENAYQEETYIPEDEPSSKAPMIIGLIIGLVVLVGGFFIYAYVYKPKMEEKAKQEQIARELREKEEADRIAKAREEEERRKAIADSVANVVVKPSIGEIVTLTERTKRYYVVVASSIDGDLAMDYAKKLSAKGVSSKIIPPFSKWKFYRLAVGDFETFADAQGNADTSKGEYGDGVWVIKY